MTDERDVLDRLVDYHDHIAAPVVPVADDVRRGRRRVRRNRGIATGAVAAGVAGVLVTASLLTGGSHDAAPTPVTSPTPTPTPTTSQGPDTWADAPVPSAKGHGWNVPDPLDAVRDGWFRIVADHLQPSPQRTELGPTSELPGEGFELPGEGSLYSTGGTIGVTTASSAEGLLADGCAYLHPVSGDHRKESCHTRQIKGPNGERVHVTSFQSLCTTWDAESAAPGVFFKNCGDYNVTVVAERRDGRVGYVVVEGRDYVEAMPFAQTDLAAAAADPRLALPDAAYEVPSDQTVVSVLADHVPDYRPGRHPLSATEHPGYAQAGGNVGRRGLFVQVWPAGGVPRCGRSSLTECVERHVYGADDPTTVFVGAWDDPDWADCCPRNSRATSRVFVYVGPRHTVVVSESLVVKEHEEAVGDDLDQRLIDLALDPRLQ